MNVKEKLKSILLLIGCSMIILSIVLLVLFAKYKNGFMNYLSFYIMFLGTELSIISDVHDIANNMHNSDIKKQLAAKAKAEEISKAYVIILLFGFFANSLSLLSCNIAEDTEILIANILFYIALFTSIAVAFYIISISITLELEKLKDPEKTINASS